MADRGESWAPGREPLTKLIPVSAQRGTGDVRQMPGCTKGLYRTTVQYYCTAVLSMAVQGRVGSRARRVLDRVVVAAGSYSG